VTYVCILYYLYIIYYTLNFFYGFTSFQLKSQERVPGQVIIPVQPSKKDFAGDEAQYLFVSVERSAQIFGLHFDTAQFAVVPGGVPDPGHRQTY